MMKKRCAMMDEELEDDDNISLGEIIIKYPNTCVAGLAQRYIDSHGFKEDDILCDDCFGK